MFKKLVSKRRLISVVVVATLLLILSWAIPALAEGSCGPATAPYEVLSSQYGVAEDGDMVFISRAIVAKELGVEVDGQSPIDIPRCFSRDDSLVTIANLPVTLTNGEKVTIVVGVVGRDRLPFGSTQEQ